MSDPKLTLCINTAALDRRSSSGRKNPFRSRTYLDREEILRNEVLPAVRAQSWDEILVVGIWEEGEGYEYIHLPPKYRDRRDALYQRELGFRYSTGDILTFCHDDHRPAGDYPDRLREADDWDVSWDILIPKRVHNQTGEELNNGGPKWAGSDRRPEIAKDGYFGAHCGSFRRWVPAEVPWTSLDVEHWDLPKTAEWRSAGAEIIWRDDLIHLDLEAGLEEK